jgi:hypothetical protein
MAHLSLRTNGDKIDMMFIQEPYCYKGEPCYVPSDYSALYTSSHPNPRAAPLIRREIAHNLMLLHQFANLENVFVVTSATLPLHKPALTSPMIPLSKTSHP